MAAIKGGSVSGRRWRRSLRNAKKEAPYFKNIFGIAKRVSFKSFKLKRRWKPGNGWSFWLLPAHHRRQYLEAAGMRDFSFDWKSHEICFRKIQQRGNSAQVICLAAAQEYGCFPMPTVAPMAGLLPNFQQLNIEKEVVRVVYSGIHLTNNKLGKSISFTNASLPDLTGPRLAYEIRSDIKGWRVRCRSFAHRTTKNGKPFGTLTLEDYAGSFTFFPFWGRLCWNSKE